MARLNEIGAMEIVRAIADGTFTAEAVAQACVERIAEREGEVRAWVYTDAESALAQARIYDRDAAKGPLCGVVVGIKDIMDTASMPTEYGSGIYAGHRPRADAACVALLRAAGATILGKTVTTEFATVRPGKTRNPYDLARTPGGSSSGSAAAVGDNMVPIALGTQTMGSVIRPAAYCGAVGFKPSFGLINRAGVKPQAESIDTIGVMGRSIDDVGLVGAVLSGARPDAFSAVLHRAPRIALYRGPDWSAVEPYAERSLDRTAERLEKAGAVVKDIGQAPILREALDAHLKVVVYELARALSFEWQHYREQISPVLIGLINAGLACSFEEYMSAQSVAIAARGWLAETFSDVDAWMTVSAPGEAPLGLDNTGDPVLNRVWSLLHVPVVTIPSDRGPNGLPLGIQLIGSYRRDALLLAVARWAAERIA